MEKELVRTYCIGLISKDTLNYLADRATEIALETNILYEEALTVLLKLASHAIGAWYKVGDEEYFEFDYNYDYFVVNDAYVGCEIACLYKDNENLIYNTSSKKFYYEYPIEEYGEDMMKVEVAL